MALSSSPKSVSFLAYDTAYEETAPCDDAASSSTRDANSGPITLAELVDALPSILRRQQEEGRESPEERKRQDEQRGTDRDPVNVLFSRLDLSLGEWKKYALFDSMKNYTRNLIATDDETFTLLLLCWNENKASPIHDHPCDGCWLRVCEGKIQETRYEIDGETDSLQMTSDEVFEHHSPAFINDSMGYHKVGNPSSSAPAVTLHLYCPPFSQCKIWLNPNDASHPSNACMCNFSEYGVKHSCELFEAICI